MKKFLIGLMALSVMALIVTGCKKQESAAIDKNDEADEVSIEKVVQEITTEIGINSPIEIDDNTLTQFIGMTYVDSEAELSLDDIEEYYGLMCTTGNSSDFILGIKSNKDKRKEVLKVLEFIQSTKARSFENFLDDEYEKAENAKIVSVGDYTFLAILGDVTDPENDAQTRIEEIINSYFAEK